MQRLFVFSLVAALTVAMAAGVAQAKGKPADKGETAQKKDRQVSYVFNGEVVSVGADSVSVVVKETNKFARGYAEAGDIENFSVDQNATKIVEDDVGTTLSDIDEGDRVLVQIRAPKSGLPSPIVATRIIAESPIAYYLDADGDGYGAGEAEYYFAGEEPEGYVSVGGDNCADVSNSDQADSDGDGIGDACNEPAPSI